MEKPMKSIIITMENMKNPTIQDGGIIGENTWLFSPNACMACAGKEE